MQKKIHVLFVEENEDGTTGGSHYCLLDLIEQLDKKQITPYVIFYEKNRIVDEFIKAGGIVKICKKKYLRKKHKSKAMSLMYKVLNFINTEILPLFQYILYLKSNRIDIVHINNSVFAGQKWVFAAKLTGKKVIAHQRGYYHHIPKFCKIHSNMYDYILGMSKSVKENLIKLDIGVDKYTTFYDRIDEKKFMKRKKRGADQIKKEFGLTDEKIIIGIVGNIQRWKGQITLVRAINEIQKNNSNVVCLLIGDTSNKINDDMVYSEEIKEEIRKTDNNKSIILTGYRNDIPDMVDALDIFVHASTHPEPYGLVVLEAMLMGKAIIASNEGGPKEMIEDGNSGFLVEPSNPKKLKEKLEVLINNEELRIKFGKNARKRYEECFSEIDIEFVTKLYNELIIK